MFILFSSGSGSAKLQFCAKLGPWDTESAEVWRGDGPALSTEGQSQTTAPEECTALVGWEMGTAEGWAGGGTWRAGVLGQRVPVHRTASVKLGHRKAEMGRE